MRKLLSMIVIVLIITLAMPAFADNIFFYHTDSAGTVLAMTDSLGEKVWEADYMPFGEEFWILENYWNDRRFVGKEKDDESGLNYFGARYLSVGTGRFLAPDPVRAVDAKTGKINVAILKDPQRVNTYAYSLNNPYRYYDPTGLFTFQLGVFGSGGAGIGGAASSGFVFGFSRKNGFQFGTYATKGVGGTSGVGASSGIEVAISMNEDINDLRGSSATVGVSYYLKVGLGVDVSINEGAKPSYSLNTGFGLKTSIPAVPEIHGYYEHTSLSEVTNREISSGIMGTAIAKIKEERAK